VRLTDEEIPLAGLVYGDPRETSAIIFNNEKLSTVILSGECLNEDCKYRKVTRVLAFLQLSCVVASHGQFRGMYETVRKLCVKQHNRQHQIMCHKRRFDKY
jgi:hypothetical protein